MEEQNPGESVRINNTFIDIAGELYDPETIELKIYDPEATLISTVTYFAGEIIRDSEGVYYYNYNIESDAIPGYYITNWNAVASGFADISEGQFRVVLIVEKLYITVDEVKSAMSGKSGSSDDEIRDNIRYAMAEVDLIAGKSFYSGTDKTEWFDTRTPNPNTFINQLFLTYTPVQAITTLKEFDLIKTMVKEYAESEYFVDSNGVIILTTGSFVHQYNRVEVVYKYGYSAVPRVISELTSVISQIGLLSTYMIEMDNAITRMSVPEISDITLGESYTSTQVAIIKLQVRKDDLVKKVQANFCNNTFVM